MDNQAAFEKTVADACAEHARAHSWDAHYRPHVVIGTDFFVKYGSPAVLEPELATQRYIFEYAKSCGADSAADTPRIPGVLHHFRDERAMYLVMEYIAPSPSTPSDSELVERMARALKWLSEVPPPPGHLMGPLGGGPIRHRFFKDFKAPHAFSSVEALERYMHKLYKLLHPRAQALFPPVKIRQDRLIFAQSDMDACNFSVDEDGRTVLLNFEDVGVLPETFVAFAMGAERFAPIVSALGLSTSSNRAMARMAGFLWMISLPGLSASGRAWFFDGTKKEHGQRALPRNLIMQTYRFTDVDRLIGPL